MKKIIVVFMLCAMTFSVSGCQTTNAQRGTLIGGAVGGLAGSQFGSGKGALVAIIAGALIGAIAGNYIGEKLDEAEALQQQNATIAALNTGSTQFWTSNTRPNQVSGHVVPTIAPDNSYNTCRDVNKIVNVKGEDRNVSERYCRPNGGRWSLVTL